MRGIVQRLINHTFLLFVWLLLCGGLMAGVFFMVFSNWLNFSDSWNEVHPSVPLLNDAFMKVIVSIIKSLETELGISHHLSRLLSQFDYGRGYAIVQTIGTLIVETIMAWSGWMLWQTRHHEMNVDEEVTIGHLTPQQATIARMNARREKRKYLLTFLFFLSVTALIWLFDFYLTYAKQIIVSERGGESLRFAWLGPAGTILLMTLISTSFAWLIEAIREHILEIIGLCFLFIDQLTGQPQLLSTVTTSQPQLPHTGEQRQQNELPGPTQQPSQPTTQPESIIMDTVEVHSINGTLNISLNELNQRWRSGEIAVDGQVYAQGAPDLSPSELFQVLNPPQGGPQDCYYTEEGLGNLGSIRYERYEDGTIMLSNP